jgi:hypothetical protein
VDDHAAARAQPWSPGITFPEPLDHGLLMRALGVTRDGAPLDGDIVVAPGERRWTFTPKEPWQAGRYELLALDILEDLAGNQIGRAFEVDNFDRTRAPIRKRSGSRSACVDDGAYVRRTIDPGAEVSESERAASTPRASSRLRRFHWAD